MPNMREKSMSDHPLMWLCSLSNFKTTPPTVYKYTYNGDVALQNASLIFPLGTMHTAATMVGSQGFSESKQVPLGSSVLVLQTCLLAPIPKSHLSRRLQQGSCLII